MRNLWVIIVTVSVTNLYLLIYSIIVKFWGNENCNVEVYSWNVTSFWTIVTRSLTFVFWLYPVMFVLWPKKATSSSASILSQLEQGMDDCRSETSADYYEG